MGINFFFFSLRKGSIQDAFSIPENAKPSLREREGEQGQKWCFRKPNTLTSVALRLKHSGSLPVLSFCCSVDDFEDLIVKLLSALVAVTVPRHCCLKNIICCPTGDMKECI